MSFLKKIFGKKEGGSAVGNLFRRAVTHFSSGIIKNDTSDDDDWLTRWFNKTFQ